MLASFEKTVCMCVCDIQYIYIHVCVCMYILMKESVFVLTFFQNTAAWYVNICPMRA